MNTHSIPSTSPLPSFSQSSTARWLTEHEVAERTGLSVSTLRKHRFERRGIEYTKVGRSVRYAEFDVVEFMAANRVTFR